MTTSLYYPSLKPNHKMPSYTEEDIADAIFDVIDKGLSMNKSVEKHNVPLSTLYTRMNGIVSRSEAI